MAPEITDFENGCGWLEQNGLTQTCLRVCGFFGDSQTDIRATLKCLTSWAWAWLARFSFQLHVCIFAYWTRKKTLTGVSSFCYDPCFLTCRTPLSLWQLLRPWPRYLNMCSEDFLRKWGFSHLLLTGLGLVSTRVREGAGEGIAGCRQTSFGAFKVGSSP